MYKIIITAFLLLTYNITLFSQSCLPEGIVFSAQSEIDNFQQNYPGCTNIEGDVEIVGSDIIQLDGLGVLVSIGGSLNIGNYTTGNTSLENLTGLNNLENIGGDLLIYNNESLNDITALNSLTTLGGSLYIFSNNSLPNLNGLNNLTTILLVQIASNYSLTSLSGLEGLINVYVLEIGREYMPNAITNLSGLNNLETIALYIKIENNPALINLSGLSSLNTIGSDFKIINNQNLISLDGINNLASIGGDLSIIENSSLYECETQVICNYLSNPQGIIEIYNNASGCNSQAEVEDACTSGIYTNAINEKIIVFNNSNEIIIYSNELQINQIVLYSYLGQIMAVKNLTNNIIDISSFSKGIYFLEVKTNKGTISQKILIN